MPPNSKNRDTPSGADAAPSDKNVGKLPPDSVETTELEPKANDPWPRRYGAAWPGGDDEESGGSP